MKVAIAYDRVNKWGGAERVLLALHKIFPDAPLYTSVYHREKAAWASVFPDIRTSWMQKISYLRDKHENVPHLMPQVFESFDFAGFDLVISVTSEAAKGIITSKKTKHICYCLTPTRYLWSQEDIYFKNRFKKFLSRPLVSYLKKWDKVAAYRPDAMLAISKAVQDRIKKYYGRDSKVIYPPVDLDQFKISNQNLKFKDLYLVVSRLVPYKRVDLAIEVFNRLKLPLYIVGTGREENKLKKIAGSTIKFLGQLTDDELAGYYKRARALIAPQEEDFGIAAVEAQCFDTPVVAFGRGGALETVIDRRTGVLFESQDVESLTRALEELENIKFNRKDFASNTRKFSWRSFEKKLIKYINKVI